MAVATINGVVNCAAICSGRREIPLVMLVLWYHYLTIAAVAVASVTVVGGGIFRHGWWLVPNETIGLLVMNQPMLPIDFDSHDKHGPVLVLVFYVPLTIHADNSKTTWTA